MKTRRYLLPLFGLLLSGAVALPAIAATCPPVDETPGLLGDDCGPLPPPPPPPPPPGPADLVSSVLIQATSSGDFAASGKVRNAGGTTVPAGHLIKVELFMRGAVSTINPPAFETVFITGPQLNPGASFTFPAQVDINSVPPGFRATVCVTADAQGAIVESNEGNNKVCSTVIIPPLEPITP